MRRPGSTTITPREEEYETRGDWVARGARARRGAHSGNREKFGHRRHVRGEGRQHHDLGGLERGRVEGVQERGGGVRQEALRRDREGRRRHQRRQDHRRDPQRQGAGRRQFLHVGERRPVLQLGRLDRPEAVPVEGQDRREHVPEDVAVLHAVQREAVCSAAPRRRLRLLLQQEDVQGGGAHQSAEDDVAVDGVCEEADEEELRRLDQGRRATTPSWASTPATLRT